MLLKVCSSSLSGQGRGVVMLFRLHAAQLNRMFGLPFERSRFGILRFDVNGIRGAAAVGFEQDKEF